MRKYLLATAFMLLASITWAQSPIGKWKTIDDETGKARSVIEIYEKDGKLYGKIVELLNLEPDEVPNPKCDACEKDDPRYNKPIIGMDIMQDMQKEGTQWEEGTILDPEKGKVYDCKIWLNEENPDELMVRGFVAFFFRTQSWYRIN